jgi:hypothetical protein
MDYAESMVQLSSVIVAAERLQRLLVRIRHCSWWVDALQVQHMRNTAVSSKPMQTSSRPYGNMWRAVGPTDNDRT